MRYKWLDEKKQQEKQRLDNQINNVYSSYQNQMQFTGNGRPSEVAFYNEDGSPVHKGELMFNGPQGTVISDAQTSSQLMSNPGFNEGYRCGGYHKKGYQTGGYVNRSGGNSISPLETAKAKNKMDYENWKKTDGYSRGNPYYADKETTPKTQKTDPSRNMPTPVSYGPPSNNVFARHSGAQVNFNTPSYSNTVPIPSVQVRENQNSSDGVIGNPYKGTEGYNTPTSAANRNRAANQPGADPALKNPYYADSVKSTAQQKVTQGNPYYADPGGGVSTANYNKYIASGGKGNPYYDDQVKSTAQQNGSQGNPYYADSVKSTAQQRIEAANQPGADPALKNPYYADSVQPSKSIQAQANKTQPETQQQTVQVPPNQSTSQETIARNQGMSGIRNIMNTGGVTGRIGDKQVSDLKSTQDVERQVSKQEAAQSGLSEDVAAGRMARLTAQQQGQLADVQAQSAIAGAQAQERAAGQLASQGLAGQQFEEGVRRFDESMAFDREKYADDQRWTEYDAAIRAGDYETASKTYGDITGKQLDPSMLQTMKEQQLKSGELGLTSQELANESARIGLTSQELANESAKIGITSQKYSQVSDLINQGMDINQVREATGMNLTQDQFDSIYDKTEIGERDYNRKIDLADTALKAGDFNTFGQIIADDFGVEIDLSKLKNKEQLEGFKDGMDIISKLASTPGMTKDLALQQIKNSSAFKNFDMSDNDLGSLFDTMNTHIMDDEISKFKKTNIYKNWSPEIRAKWEAQAESMLTGLDLGAQLNQETGEWEKTVKENVTVDGEDVNVSGIKTIEDIDDVFGKKSEAILSDKTSKLREPLIEKIATEALKRGGGNKLQNMNIEEGTETYNNIVKKIEELGKSYDSFSSKYYKAHKERRIPGLHNKKTGDIISLGGKLYVLNGRLDGHTGLTGSKKFRYNLSSLDGTPYYIDSADAGTVVQGVAPKFEYK